MGKIFQNSIAETNPTLDQVLRMIKLRLPQNNQQYPHMGGKGSYYKAYLLRDGSIGFRPEIYNNFLFRGESGFINKDKSYSMLGFQDFSKLLQSYPLFRLFAEGINIPNLDMRIKFGDIQGIAASYGDTPKFVPFTSELDIAAFYAVTKYNAATQSREPIRAHESPLGVIRVMEMQQPLEQISGVFPIGFQAFIRPGIQKTFAVYVPSGLHIENHKWVTTFVFRQDDIISQRIYNEFKNGDVLMPQDDLLAKKLRILKDDPSQDKKFTNLDLEPLKNNIDGEWGQLCDVLHFSGPHAVQLEEALREVPKIDKYKEILGL